jgi:hypothetical protein
VYFCVLNEISSLNYLFFYCRDSSCGNTIHEAFTRASHPERVKIAIVEQVCVRNHISIDTGKNNLKSPCRVFVPCPFFRIAMKTAELEQDGGRLVELLMPLLMWIVWRDDVVAT